MPDRRRAADRAPIPRDLRDAVEANPDAAERFARMPPSHRARYAAWVGEAKRDDARRRRIERAVDMIAEWEGSRGR